MGEQELVGRRVEQPRAGVYLAGTNVTADTLRSAVHRVLGDPSFRDRAAALGQSFRAAGGADAVRMRFVAFVR